MTGEQFSIWFWEETLEKKPQKSSQHLLAVDAETVVQLMHSSFTQKYMIWCIMFIVCFSYSSWEVPEVVSHAEESAAEYFGGSGEVVVDDTSRISDSQTLKTLVGGHWGSKVKHNHSEQNRIFYFQWRNSIIFLVDDVLHVYPE